MASLLYFSPIIGFTSVLSRYITIFVLFLMTATRLSALASPNFHHNGRSCSSTTSLLSKASSSSSSVVRPKQNASSNKVKSSLQAMQFISGIEQLATTHDTFLLDMWGVMHNGVAPYPGVLHCVQQLSRAGKRLIILSNSSKRSHHATKLLSKLGFDPNHFHAIWTSGEVCHRMLSGDTTLSCETWPILTQLISSSQTKAFILGSGDDDISYVTSAGWTVAKDISEANMIIARGTFTIVSGNAVISKDNSPELYQEKLHHILNEAAKLRIPMLICNSDKVRPDESLSPMPGAIGDAYVEALQQTHMPLADAQWLVKRIGKPYQEMYQLALSSIGGCSEMARLGSVMVGDALETDITGGLTLACNTVWVVRDGVHSSAVTELEEEFLTYHKAAECVVQNFNDSKGLYGSTSKMGQEDGSRSIVPTFVVPNFRWGV